jgi:hypothetical protein
MHKKGRVPEENIQKGENVGRGKEKSCNFLKVFFILAHIPKLPHSHYPEYERLNGKKIGLSVLC